MAISILIDGMSVETQSSSEQRLWLLSRRADFWLLCGGASVGLIAAILVIYWHGDREIDAFDLVLSEFHLGATYDAIIRRRLWRTRWVDTLVIPLMILSLTYWLSISSQAVLLTSIAMYAAVWHRGRQSLGVARFYQRAIGGPASRMHSALFRGAIYLPMLAAMLAYSHLAPSEYDGEPYFALSLSAGVTSTVGLAAVVWVIAYLAWTGCGARALSYVSGKNVNSIHPGEWWVVVAHAVAFGSGYALGASDASYLLVLAVYHEVQYLSFTYAMARRTAHSQSLASYSPIADFDSRSLSAVGHGFRAEASFVASFLFWPVIGFVGALAGSWLKVAALTPLGAGGLFCHYWLDGRIWTRPSAHA
jgi:hypothetical protein